MRASKGARWALVVAAVAALVFAAAAAARTHAAAKKGPIVIGWAHDDSAGPMGPFDLPALAAAQIEIKKVNKKNALGRKIVLKTCDTQKDDPTASKACADQLISQGAKIILTTCDVDLAAPVVQDAINHHLLAVAPCIGTDQMGPKRFGSGGKLAFSFGNVAQDEGSAMAEVAWKHGWKTADLAKDNAIVYFKAVVSAFKARFEQLGGKIKYETTYTDKAFGGNDVQNAVTGLNAHKAAVIVTSTAGAFQSLGPFITGIRTAGNKTPILNSWAGDGTYWVGGLNPKVTNYWFVTYANAFGHDPSKTVNKLAKQVQAGTGGFITGPATIDGLVTAIKRAHGSLVGSKLAAVMQKFHNVKTLSGKVSFSKKLHSVFGRQYRVIEINNNKPIEKGLIRAKKVPNSPDS
ncbi:MAG TPA: ABC transporter substrate-binding protein [Gaiellaceae bacterium]|jgi:branched-chain amino acid transport system substrate-binding protein